jgi:hypothetical protein
MGGGMTASARCLFVLPTVLPLVLALTSGFSATVRAQLEELRSANVAEVGKGLRLSRLHGSKVFNDQHEQIGTVFDFVVGQDYALFAVLEVGGFLGLGAHLVAVPLKTLVFDDLGRSFLLPGATRKALRGFPEFRFLSGL